MPTPASSPRSEEAVTMVSWVSELNQNEKKTMAATFGGWTLDAFDVMLYSFVMSTLIATWGISKGEAGLLGSAALLSSCVGGVLAGYLADRFGRVRILQVTIVWFSFFTLLSAFTQNFDQLLIMRVLQGIGFGGEWACGAVLLSETIRAKYRGRALSVVQSGHAFGWGLAAILYWAVFSLVPEQWAWRVMFALGVLPAFFVLYVRKHVREPELFQRDAAKNDEQQVSRLAVFTQPGVLRYVFFGSLLTTGLQGAYYAMTTWLPTYLKQERGLSVFGTSGYTLVFIVGSILGVWAGGFIADRYGRKKAFALCAVLSIALTYSYMVLPISDTAMLWLGLPLGAVVAGGFGPFGAYLAELFPSRVRGTAQGLTYNAGRAVGALMPALIGFLSAKMALNVAIAVFTMGANVLLLLVLLFLPETRGMDLAARDKESERNARSS
ncbi:MFS transporter [Bordetella genomosp. 12]|uniref:MFS transporter n=1 Tax=Bordetella genomosp. 12 TaxID=463035 RepID=A0A261VCU6_9BORD|nr:MFS transporter [Bordetella genomosp. 12]OZI71657.1 MFS transporter [Bordetella genomosp. 12]